jgi:hypothetical protein
MFQLTGSLFHGILRTQNKYAATVPALIMLYCYGFALLEGDIRTRDTYSCIDEVCQELVALYRNRGMSTRQ